MPKVAREGNMASSEGGNEVVFTGTDCPFSRICPVITRGDIFYRNLTVYKKAFYYVGLLVIHNDMGDRLGALREEGTQGFEGIAVGGGGSRDLGGIGNIA
jgi:hypothetical protein